MAEFNGYFNMSEGADEGLDDTFERGMRDGAIAVMLSQAAAQLRAAADSVKPIDHVFRSQEDVCDAYMSGLGCDCGHPLYRNALAVAGLIKGSRVVERLTMFAIELDEYSRSID